MTVCILKYKPESKIWENLRRISDSYFFASFNLVLQTSFPSLRMHQRVVKKWFENLRFCFLRMRVIQAWNEIGANGEHGAHFRVNCIFKSSTHKAGGWAVVMWFTSWSDRHMSSLGLLSSLLISSSSRLSSCLRCLFILFSSRFSCFTRSFSWSDESEELTS